MQTVNIKSTPHFESARDRTRRMDIGFAKSKLKQLFTLRFKVFKSCSGTTLTPVMTDEENNKENRPLERELPFQQAPPSPWPETEDDGSELPTNGVERLCELEEEMIWLRMRLQRLGEESSFIVRERLKHIMKTTISEYEVKFGEIVKANLKSQMRCTVMEDELRKTTERLYHCEQELETEKRKVLELKHLAEYVKTSLVQEVEKQTCRMCQANVRNTVVFPCMHFLCCSECLHDHQRRNGQCPTCQAPITAAVYLNLKME